MLMRVALVYVMAVISAVLAFALYWQEGRLATIQDSFLKASNELAAKSAEIDAMRQRKTASEERAYQAEASLRDVKSEQEAAAAEIAQAKKIKEEAEAALSKAQLQVREATAAKTAATERAADLEAKLNRATAELEALKGPGAVASQSSANSASGGPAASSTPITRKVLIEPDPTVRQQGTPAAPMTTQSITPAPADSAQAASPAPVGEPTVAEGQPDKADASKPAAVKTAKPKATAAKRKPKTADQPSLYFPF